MVNKTDLAPYVGVDVAEMMRDADLARDGRPVLALSRADRASVEELIGWVRQVLTTFRAEGFAPIDPGAMAPHAHADGSLHAH